jgi:hypothetical protein
VENAHAGTLTRCCPEEAARLLAVNNFNDELIKAGFGMGLVLLERQFCLERHLATPFEAILSELVFCYRTAYDTTTWRSIMCVEL